MNILEISAICVITAIIAKVIQPSNSDMAAALSIATAVSAAFLIILGLKDTLFSLESILSGSGIESRYIMISMKAISICYVCDISSSCCRDCGENALASVIDISGRLTIAIICFPLIEGFISSVRSILEL